MKYFQVAIASIVLLCFPVAIEWFRNASHIAQFLALLITLFITIPLAFLLGPLWPFVKMYFDKE